MIQGLPLSLPFSSTTPTCVSSGRISSTFTRARFAASIRVSFCRAIGSFIDPESSRTTITFLVAIAWLVIRARHTQAIEMERFIGRFPCEVHGCRLLRKVECWSEIKIGILNSFCRNPHNAEFHAHVLLGLVQRLWFGHDRLHDPRPNRLHL